MNADQIVTEPHVYVTGHSVADRAEMRRYLADNGFDGKRVHWDAGDAELLTEWAARICYQSWDTGRTDLQAFLDNLLGSAHGGVLRGVTFNLTVTGISRSCSQELLRHHVGFEGNPERSELSQRYVAMDRIRFVLPPRYIGDSVLTGGWKLGMDDALDNYHTLVDLELLAVKQTTISAVPRDERKRILEAARSVLPNATATEMVLSGNIEAFRFILEQRVSEGADLEINRLGFAIYQALLPRALGLLQDYTAEELPDGGHELKTDWRKV